MTQTELCGIYHNFHPLSTQNLPNLKFTKRKDNIFVKNLRSKFSI